METVTEYLVAKFNWLRGKYLITGLMVTIFCMLPLSALFVGMDYMADSEKWSFPLGFFIFLVTLLSLAVYFECVKKYEKKVTCPICDYSLLQLLKTKAPIIGSLKVRHVNFKFCPYCSARLDKNFEKCESYDDLVTDANVILDDEEPVIYDD